MEKLTVTELDFESIKLNIKAFLQNKSEFTDYNFDGAGLSYLIDLLAYNTHYNAYYLNMVANELFLDTAIVRESVLSHAKALNYTPTSSRGAVANVTITVTPASGNTQSSLVLDRYQLFQSDAVDSVNYTFTTTETYTSYKEDSVFTFSNIPLTQGNPEIYRQTYNATTNPKRQFILPDTTIDTSTLLVVVQTSSVNSSSQTFTLAADVTGVDDASLVYFLDTSTEERYKVSFGDGVIGQALANGNIVITSYLTTDGSDGNFANTFTTGSINGFSSVTVTSNSAAAGGGERQEIDAIRYRAPLAYTAQNRMVTPLDYETLMKNEYPNFRSLSVWGGEENTPPIYGKVFLSYLLKSGVVINETEKARIIKEIIIPYSVVSITPEFLDPDFIYLRFKITIKFNPAITTLNAAQISAQAQTSVEDYTTQEFDKFGGVLIPSKLERLVDDVSTSIVGNHSQIRLEKRFTPTLNITKTYLLDYGFELFRSGVTGGLESTGFYVNDSAGISRLVYFDEEPNSSTGVDSILVDNAGFSYTDVPTITITGDGTGATALASIVNGKVVSVAMLTRGIGYTQAVVTISGGGGASALATAVIAARYGTLRTFYYNSLSQKIIINATAGSIDYSIGLITITNFKSTSVFPIDGKIRIHIQPEIGILTAKRNQILRLDTTDATALQVTTTT